MTTSFNALKLLITVLIVNWFYARLYKGFWKGSPKIMCKKEDRLMQQRLQLCESMKEKFYPTFWAHGANLQMVVFVVYQILFRNKCKYRHHLVKTSDNGELRCDEYIPPKSQEHPKTAPICLFLHTITGDSASCNEFVMYVSSRGWRPFVLCRRGHFGKLTSPKFNVMGDVEDTALMINHVASLYPDSKFMGAVGISAGSGQLVSYIGQQKDTFPVHSAVSLCPAYSMKDAFLDWNKKHPFLSKYLLRNLKSKFLHQNKELLEGQRGYTDALQSSSVHDFIVKSVQMAGFSSFEEYLKHSDPMTHYQGNKIPCLVINAKDDPICLEKNIRYDLMENVDNYALLVTEYGSHIAFREGLLGQKSYIHRLTMDFLQASYHLHSE